MSFLANPVRASLVPALLVPVIGAWVFPEFLGLHWALGWFVGVNLSAFVVWAIDKRQARAGRLRVPEWTLHGLSLAGGGLGAVVAMRKLRHKTRHRVFTLWHPLLAALGVAGLGWLMWKG